ncbi:MAG: AMP-binding protein [Deltaproteobacteria bacterium]|nr:AMP-binding protein [Deltaproteobacteria bacterium]
MANYSFFPVSFGKSLPLKGLTLPELLKNQANRFADKIFLKYSDSSISYKDFDDKTDRMAYSFRRHGIKKGDRIAVMLQNSLEIVETYFAIWKTGAWSVPVNPSFTAREVEYVISDSAAKVMVIGETEFFRMQFLFERSTALENIILCSKNVDERTISYSSLNNECQDMDRVELSSDDVCQIMYTSGTEGKPKGVLTTHGGYTDNAYIRSTILELAEEDRTLIALPLFHMFAVSTLLNFITVGGTVIITERFNTQEVLDLVSQNKITFFTGVPTMYSYILNHPEINNYDLSSIRLCIIAGGNVNYDVVKEFENRFRCLFIESMGQTELSPLVMINPPYRDRRRLGSCGLTAFNMVTRLVDENDEDVPLGETGELVVRSPCIMRGYYNLEDENRHAFRGGWYHTGDLLRQDKDGYYYFVDRKKDMIVTAGYNIYAKELENVLLSHPAVMEAAVISVPDQIKGELAKALIVIKKGGSVSKEELENHARQNLAPYKVPRIIEFVEELPHTPQGKIAKGTLRETEKHKSSK